MRSASNCHAGKRPASRAAAATVLTGRAKLFRGGGDTIAAGGVTEGLFCADAASPGGPSAPPPLDAGYPPRGRSAPTVEASLPDRTASIAVRPYDPLHADFL